MLLPLIFTNHNMDTSTDCHPAKRVCARPDAAFDSAKRSDRDDAGPATKRTHSLSAEEARGANWVQYYPWSPETPRPLEPTFHCVPDHVLRDLQELVGDRLCGEILVDNDLLGDRGQYPPGAVLRAIHTLRLGYPGLPIEQFHPLFLNGARISFTLKLGQIPRHPRGGC